jgi:hypothetical protein
MVIDLDDLRKVTNLLYDHIERNYGNNFVVKHDYYWELDKDELLDFNNNPKDFTIGQYSHDWERLQKMLGENDLVISYGLVWLASIIKYIGEQKIE